MQSFTWYARGARVSVPSRAVHSVTSVDLQQPPELGQRERNSPPQGADTSTWRRSRGKSPIVGDAVPHRPISPGTVLISAVVGQTPSPEPHEAKVAFSSLGDG